MRRSPFPTCVAVFSLLGVAGCGGHGISLNSSLPVSSRTLTKVTTSLHWAARSRSVNGPASALSATIIYQNPALTNTLATQSVDRVVSPAAYTASYSSTTTVSPGAYVLTIVFHSGSGSFGLVVATAVASVVVTQNGTITDPNGKPLNVDASTNLTAASIVPNQSLSIGQATTVAVSASDRAGNIFPVSPGSTFISIVAGGDKAKLLADGSLYGLLPGNVTIAASVDGIKTSQVTLTVVPPTVTARSVVLSTNAILLNPTSGLLYATIPSIGGKFGNRIVEINPASGNVARSVFVGSEPGAMGLSDDGTTLYVALNGSSSIRTVATKTFALGAPFSIPIPPFSTGLTVTDLAVQPGNPNVIAITTQDNQDTGNDGPKIFDHGVPRKNSLGIYEGQSLAWTSPSLIYAFDNTDTGFALEQATVDSTGAKLKASLGGRFNGFGTIIKAFGTTIYGSDGNMVDAISGNLIGKVSSYGQDVTVDLKAKRILIAGSQVGQSQLAINEFSSDQFLPTTSFTIPNVLDPSNPYERISGLCRWGTHGIAFRTPTQLFFLTLTPGV